MKYTSFYSTRNTDHDYSLHMPKGQVIAGYAIGIIYLETWYPIVPGNVCHANTYPFPVLYQKVIGSDPQKIYTGDPSMLDAIINAARELEKQGVRAISGACGYMGNYQSKVASAVNVPVFMSSLLQLPMIYHSLKPTQRIGILCATGTNMAPKLLEECGASNIPIASIGLEDQPEFRNITYSLGEFNYHRMEKEVVSAAVKLIKQHPDIGAILLECSDMPPFASAVQEAVHLPVFDFITMIKWMYSGVRQTPYEGVCNF